MLTVVTCDRQTMSDTVFVQTRRARTRSADCLLTRVMPHQSSIAQPASPSVSESNISKRSYVKDGAIRCVVKTSSKPCYVRSSKGRMGRAGLPASRPFPNSGLVNCAPDHAYGSHRNVHAHLMCHLCSNAPVEMGRQESVADL